MGILKVGNSIGNPKPPQKNNVKLFFKGGIFYMMDSDGKSTNLSNYNAIFYKTPVDSVIQNKYFFDIFVEHDFPIGYRVLVFEDSLIYEKNAAGEWKIETEIVKDGAILFNKSVTDLDDYYVYGGGKYHRVNQNLGLAHIAKRDNPHRVTKSQVHLDALLPKLQATDEEFLTHKDDTRAHAVTKAQVGLGNVDNTPQISAQILRNHIAEQNPHGTTWHDIDALSMLTNDLQATPEQFILHATLLKNPHGVTKADIGLGDVDNVEQASDEFLQAHINLGYPDADPHKTDKTSIGLGRVRNVKQYPLADFITEHVQESNPHNTNKADIGLGNVDNVKQAKYVDFEQHISLTKPGGASNTNPHGVTKESLGLGDVDNTPQATLVAYQSHIDKNVDQNPHGVTKYELYPPLDQVINEPQLAKATFESHLLDVINRDHKLKYFDVIGLEGGNDLENSEQEEHDVVASHITNTNNPHAVDKAAIDLENVVDIKQATYTDYHDHIVTQRNPHNVAPEQIDPRLLDVDNTSDVDKLISTSQQQSLQALQNNINPVIVGTNGTLNADILPSILDREMIYYGTISSDGTIENCPDDSINTFTQLLVSVNTSGLPDNGTKDIFLYVGEDFTELFFEYELKIGDFIIIQRTVLFDIAVSAKINNISNGPVYEPNDISFGKLGLITDTKYYTPNNQQYYQIDKLLSLYKDYAFSDETNIPTWKVYEEINNNILDYYKEIIKSHKHFDYLTKKNHGGAGMDFNNNQTGQYRDIAGFLYPDFIIANDGTIGKANDITTMYQKGYTESPMTILSAFNGTLKIAINDRITTFVMNIGSTGYRIFTVDANLNSYNIRFLKVYDVLKNKVVTILSCPELFETSGRNDAQNSVLINGAETYVKIKSEIGGFIVASFDENTNTTLLRHVNGARDDFNAQFFNPYTIQHIAGDESGSGYHIKYSEEVRVSNLPISEWLYDCSVFGDISEDNRIIFDLIGRIVTRYTIFNNSRVIENQSYTITDSRVIGITLYDGKNIIQISVLNKTISNRKIKKCFQQYNPGNMMFGGITQYYLREYGDNIPYIGWYLNDTIQNEDINGRHEIIDILNYNNWLIMAIYCHSENIGVLVYNELYNEFGINPITAKMIPIYQSVKSYIVNGEYFCVLDGEGMLQFVQYGITNGVSKIVDYDINDHGIIKNIEMLGSGEFLLLFADGSVSRYDYISDTMAEVVVTEQQKIFYIKDFITFCLMVGYTDDAPDEHYVLYYDTRYHKVMNFDRSYNFGKYHDNVKAYINGNGNIEISGDENSIEISKTNISEIVNDIGYLTPLHNFLQQ